MNNEIPRNPKVILALGEGAAAGCLVAQDEVGLKLVRSTDLLPLIVGIKGVEDFDPPVFGYQFDYDEAKKATLRARTALSAKDAEVKTFLTDARDVLKKVLGTKWSPDWAQAGYTEPGSTAVPNTQDERYNSLNALRNYLTAHPTYQVPGGGVHPEVTAARALALHTQITDGRLLIQTSEATQEDKKQIFDEAITALRNLLIALVDELPLRLSPTDGRWEIFGFNIPANPRPPTPATALTLELAGPGRLLAEWTRGARSDDNRVMIWIEGTDTEWREYGKSGNTMAAVIKDLPAGATVKVQIIALNGDLEAPSGPEAQIVMP